MLNPNPDFDFEDMDLMDSMSMNPYSLNTIDAEALMAYHFEPKKFLVEGLLPCGLTLLCGRPKTGKSWMVMNLCLSVSQGEPFLNHPTTKSDVLYLALEDPMHRIKDRMAALSEECPRNLRFCNEASCLGGLLIDQLTSHLSGFPETRLIIIDTLQKIRGKTDEKKATNTPSYSGDYTEMAELKRFADEREICILLVHHLRKMRDREDPFNEIAGSTGLMGAADSAFVLMRQTRGSDYASLVGTGRDFPDIEIKLDFTAGLWTPVEETVGDRTEDQFCPYVREVIAWIKEHGAFEGTASELIRVLDLKDCRPNVLIRWLSGDGYCELKKGGIRYQTGRNSKGRWVSLSPMPETENEGEGHDDHVGGDANDAKVVSVADGESTPQKPDADTDGLQSVAVTPSFRS